MNTTDILNEVLDELEVIKLRAEHFDKIHNQSFNKTWSGDLHYVLSKLQEVSEFLKPSTKQR